jgi:hypothetical protein
MKMGKNLCKVHIDTLGGNGGLAPIKIQRNPLQSKGLRISMATGLGTECRVHGWPTIYIVGGGGFPSQPLAEFPHPLKQGLRGCSNRSPDTFGV